MHTQAHSSACTAPRAPVTACLCLQTGAVGLANLLFRNPDQVNVRGFTAQRNLPRAPSTHTTLLGTSCDSSVPTQFAPSCQRRAGSSRGRSRRADAVWAPHLASRSVQGGPVLPPRGALILSDSGGFSALPTPLFFCPPFQLSQPRCGCGWWGKGVSHHLLRAPSTPDTLPPSLLCPLAIHPKCHS